MWKEKNQMASAKNWESCRFSFCFDCTFVHLSVSSIWGIAIGFGLAYVAKSSQFVDEKWDEIHSSLNWLIHSSINNHWVIGILVGKNEASWANHEIVNSSFHIFFLFSPVFCNIFTFTRIELFYLLVWISMRERVGKKIKTLLTFPNSVRPPLSGKLYSAIAASALKKGRKNTND